MDDLNYSIGHAALNSVTILSTYTKTSRSLDISYIKAWAECVDLYDFDYFTSYDSKIGGIVPNGLVQAAAIQQIGWGRGNGNSGKLFADVFKVYAKGGSDYFNYSMNP